MINCILLVLLLLQSMVLLKCTSSSLMIHFIDFVLFAWSIGTFNYNLDRFFCDLLSPLVPNNYSCKDTCSFVSQIKNANLCKTFLVCYNVFSLFTNISLQETISIAINLIFNHNPNRNITRKELEKLFFFTTSQTHFIFNSNFYNQIDGVAMVLL